MLLTTFSALLPIMVTIALGFFAGWKHDFSGDQSKILNSMVMKYALPMCLFANLMATPRRDIFENKNLLLWIGFFRVVLFLIALISMLVLTKEKKNIAALRAYSMTSPSVTFLGLTILSSFFGQNEATLVVVIWSLMSNLIVMPILLFFLESAEETQNGSKKKVVLDSIKSAVSKSIVWAPLLAFILVMLGVKIPPEIKNSFTFLGNATGGVALFASGITLYSYKVTFSKQVVFDVFIKNIVFPAVVLGILWITHQETSLIKVLVVAMAIPTASSAVIVSTQYKEGQAMTASTFGVSTFFSVITLPLFVYISNLL